MQNAPKVSGAKKFLSLMLCSFMVLSIVACGSKDDSSSEPAPVVTPSAVEEQPEEPVALEAAFLTGLEKGGSYPEGQRIIAVMINNIAKSRPARGISEAQILVEAKVEGGITRFMAIFEDYEAMPEVGPVRSARDQFLQLVLPFQAFYVHDGPNQNQPTNWMLNDYDYWDFDLQWGTYGNLAWRDQARVAAGYSTEHTEYTDGAHVASVVSENGLDGNRQYNSPIFSFVPYNEPKRTPDEGAASEVAVIHSSSYRTLFNYDGSRYLMSQFSSSTGSIHNTIDDNNQQQVAFDNLLVLFAPMSLYDGSDLVKVRYSNGGAGYYFSNGGYEVVRWDKGPADSPLTLSKLDDPDAIVSLNPGTTYIAIVDDNELEDFDTALKSGDASSAAMGDVNANEVDAED